MTEQRLQRPRQVTVAVGLGLFGCLVFVISLYDAVGASYSLAAREAVTELLSRPPYDGLGLTVEEALRMLRTALYGMGVAVAVAFVLSFYVFQRSNAARIGFTVASVLLVPALVGPQSLGIAAIVVAFAAIGLWSEPARDWFAGRAPRPVADSPAARPVPLARQLSADQPPPASTPFGAPRVPDFASFPPPDQPPPRPRSVSLAVIITRVSSALTGLFVTMAVLRLATDRTAFEAEVAKSLDTNRRLDELGVTPSDLWLPTLVLTGLIALWCVAAYALTFFVLRRAGWARIALLVSAGNAALVSLIALLTIVSVFPLVASGLAIRLLLQRESAAWFAWRPPTPL